MVEGNEEIWEQSTIEDITHGVIRKYCAVQNELALTTFERSKHLGMLQVFLCAYEIAVTTRVKEIFAQVLTGKVKTT